MDAFKKTQIIVQIAPDPMIESWGFSLRATYEILEPFIRDMEESGKIGRAYWEDLDWLYQKAVEAETGKQTREAASGKRRHLMRPGSAGEQYAG